MKWLNERENHVINKFKIRVSFLLMSSLNAIDICQTYFEITVISSQIPFFAPSLIMKRTSSLAKVPIRFPPQRITL